MKAERGLTPYQLESSFDRRAIFTPDGRRKAQLFAALAPAGCSSILDVGGGTGWATVGLRPGRRVVTLDSSPESLAHAPGETVLAEIDELPFDDGSFDMVLSSQVLEHLPDDVLERAAAEMMRVAKVFLLVSVPYREALGTRFVRCADCGHRFHPDYHCRSFREGDLASLFPGWLMAEWHVFGATSMGMGVLRERQSRRRRPDRQLEWAGASTVCPRCGAVGEDGRPPMEPRRTIAARVEAAVAWPLQRLLPGRLRNPYVTFLPQGVAPYWIAALFVREGAEVDGRLEGML